MTMEPKLALFTAEDETDDEFQSMRNIACLGLGGFEIKAGTSQSLRLDSPAASSSI